MKRKNVRSDSITVLLGTIGLFLLISPENPGENRGQENRGQTERFLIF
jgi:hypothetical protein